MKLQQWFLKRWYSTKPIIGLIPASWIFQMIVVIRRYCYEKGWLTVHRFPVPIIVVGNITLGGSGKTPTVMALVKGLQQRGFKPGIVSRGYGGQNQRQAMLVTKDSSTTQVGDEAVLLAQTVSCPVVVCVDRVKAVNYLIQHGQCDVIVSDDGLQHYSLYRNIEIITMDGTKRLGNAYCLPAGPLRESVKRLQQASLIVIKSTATEQVKGGEYRLNLRQEAFYSVKSPLQQCGLEAFVGQTVHAVAGIAHPAAFFQSLQALGINTIEHIFPDHYPFKSADITFADNYPVIMTGKDAVKCQSFAENRHWYLHVKPELSSDFWDKFEKVFDLYP